MKIIKLTKILLILFFITSCKSRLEIDQQLNNTDQDTTQDVISEKNNMEIRFSCGENEINKYLKEGWVIKEEYTEEKICTWKSFPATKDCDMDKDKGCKITKPDKIGEEKIYLLEKNF